MTQVPFVLVDDRNKHSDDPERFRGEVRSIDLADDGLYATIEPSERGEQVLKDNPRLPVSVRQIVPDVGKFKGKRVLAHVAGTLDEVAKHMKPWEVIEASAELELLDLSEGSFSTDPIAKDGDTTATDGLSKLSDEEQGTFKSLVAKLTGKNEKKGAEEEKDKGKDAGKADEPTEAEIQKAIDELVAEAEKETEEAGKEGEPVAASLSAEDKKTLDMANERAERAEKDARDMALKTGKVELSNRFKQYVRDGVPPAMVNAAQEKIESKDDTVLDFARGKQAPEFEALFAALDAAKGTIDFSERGSLEAETDADEDKAKERRETAEAAAKGWT
jgi:hypothetical protein